MIDLILDFNEMSVITKAKLKEMVKDKVEKFAFEKLTEKKNTRKKYANIIYDELSLATYLTDKDLKKTVQNRQFLFQCRTNEVNVKSKRR